MVAAPWMPWSDVEAIIARADDPHIGFYCTFNPYVPDDFLKQHNPNLYAIQNPGRNDWQGYLITYDKISLEWIKANYTEVPNSYADIMLAFKLYRKVSRATAAADIAWIDDYIDRAFREYILASHSSEHELCFMRMKTKLKELANATSLTFDEYCSLLTATELSSMHCSPRVRVDPFQLYDTHMCYSAPLESLIGLGIPMTHLMYNRHITMDHVLECEPQLTELHWMKLSRNPAITFQIMQQYPDLPWNMRGVCANPGLTLADVCALIKQGVDPVAFQTNTFDRVMEAGRKIARFAKAMVFYNLHVRRAALIHRVLSRRIRERHLRNNIVGFEGGS
jgi:hypothetical protein